MREIRIYTDQPLTSGQDIRLEAKASRHLVSVLRLKSGHPVTVFNGKGGVYSAVISRADNKAATLAVGEHRPADCESPLAIHLGIGISRGDRMDWVIQKATELGVNTIIPLYTERTEVKLKSDRSEKKLRHWQQIAISACEQSGRNFIPEVCAPALFDNWLNANVVCEAAQKLVLHHRSDSGLGRIVNTPASVALLIGPEGGLSADEISRAMDDGFQALTLGPRVLRTETAPLAAISILQSLWGDMG